MAHNFGIKGFIPISMLDWPGKISSVMFLGGCCFRCPACHNHKLVLEPDSLPDLSVDEILSHLHTRNTWIDGVTVTGGEPTIRENLPDLLRLFKESCVKIKLDTNGSNPAMLEALIADRLIDGVSMDVKAPLTEAEYSRAAGVRVDVDAISRSIEILKNSDLEVAFRTTAIPGLVEEPEIVEIRNFLGDVPTYQVQSFRNVDTLDPELAAVEPFSPRRMEEIRMRFEIPSPIVEPPRLQAWGG